MLQGGGGLGLPSRRRRSRVGNYVLSALMLAALVGSLALFVWHPKSALISLASTGDPHLASEVIDPVPGWPELAPDSLGGYPGPEGGLYAAGDPDLATKAWRVGGVVVLSALIHFRGPQFDSATDEMTALCPNGGDTAPVPSLEGGVSMACTTPELYGDVEMNAVIGQRGSTWIVEVSGGDTLGEAPLPMRDMIA